MSTSAPTVKAALVAMITAAVGDRVLVTYGHPGFSIPDDVIAVGDVVAETEVKAMGAPRRRDETLRLSATVSCYRGGGPEVQQTVTERAYALLGAVYAAVQTDPTIGGTCRDAAVTSHEMREETDPDLLADGRTTEIVFVVTTVARV